MITVSRDESGWDCDFLEMLAMLVIQLFDVIIDMENAGQRRGFELIY